MNAVPKGKVKEVSRMQKAIHAQEDKDAARQKTSSITVKLRKERPGNAAQIRSEERRVGKECYS